MLLATATTKRKCNGSGERHRGTHLQTHIHTPEVLSLWETTVMIVLSLMLCWHQVRGRFLLAKRSGAANADEPR